VNRRSLVPIPEPIAQLQHQLNQFRPRFHEGRSIIPPAPESHEESFKRRSAFPWQIISRSGSLIGTASMNSAASFVDSYG